MSLSFTINQEYELTDLADKISPLLQHQQILFFEGEVGSGKTTFIRYLLKSLAVKANQDFHFLGSPTYQREHRYNFKKLNLIHFCLLYTSPSPRDYAASRMPSSA